MRLDKPRLLDPDSAITREIAREFPDASPVESPCAHLWKNQKVICSRRQGHDGPHVAYDFDGPLAVWPREDGK